VDGGLWRARLEHQRRKAKKSEQMRRPGFLRVAGEVQQSGPRKKWATGLRLAGRAV